MNILDKIITTKKEEIALAKKKIPLLQLESQMSTEVRGFTKALQKQLALGKPGIIAEIKKASPSKGVIRQNFDPTLIAKSYSRAGATCLSVLTDEQYFQGSADYLKQAHEACQLPILRKDFIIDPYQIFESKVMGADCVLLIVAALTQPILETLYEVAIELNLDVLIEVHNKKELEMALNIPSSLIGINNRDLKTFETKLENTLELLPMIPKDRIIVTESGIHTSEDVGRMRKNGVNTFLVGESMMRSDDPGKKLIELFF